MVMIASGTNPSQGSIVTHCPRSIPVYISFTVCLKMSLDESNDEQFELMLGTAFQMSDIIVFMDMELSIFLSPSFLDISMSLLYILSFENI